MSGMKCQVQLCLCQDCDCLKGNSKFKKNDREKKHDMFELLAHNPPSPNYSKRKVTTVRKIPTTYRQDFIQKKVLIPTKIHRPYSALMFHNQNLSTGTTHKCDYKSYTAKKIEESRGTRVNFTDNLSCAKAPFEGKSETKSAYKCPVTKKAYSDITSSGLCSSSSSKRMKKTSPDKPEISTYKANYKKHKVYQASAPFKPKGELSCRKQLLPFTATSQYMCDYKRKSSSIRDNFKKMDKYDPPTIPMNSSSEYKSEYYHKVVADKRTSKWDRSRGDSRKKDVCPCVRPFQCKRIGQQDLNPEIRRMLGSGDGIPCDVNICTDKTCRYE